MSYLYSNLVGHTSEYSLILIHDLKAKTDRPLTEIEAIYGTKIYEHQKQIIDHVSKPMYSLIKRMMDLDPYKRISIGEALREYKALLPSIREYLKADVLSPAIKISHPTLPEKNTQPSPFLVAPPLPPSPPTPISPATPPNAKPGPIIQIARASSAPHGTQKQKKGRIFKVVRSQMPVGPS